MKISACFVPTKENEIADSLSRFQHNRFKVLTQNLQINAEKTPVPDEIANVQEIWLY